MSTKMVYTCDVCSLDVPVDSAYAMQSPLSTERAAAGTYSQIHVCSSCLPKNVEPAIQKLLDQTDEERVSG